MGMEGQIEEHDTTGEIVQDDDGDYGYGDPLDEDSDDDADGVTTSAHGETALRQGLLHVQPQVVLHPPRCLLHP